MSRQLLLLIGLVLGAWTGSGHFSVALGDPPSRPPNIVFILADDLGYGDLRCYGQQTLDAPRIDRMASEGLRFTQHYAGSTVCAPSRACLLTGQHTGHVHQRANGKIAFRADPQDQCVASLLQQAGYATAMIGKSGLSCRSDNPLLPNQKGFDHFFGYISHGAAHRYFPRFLWRDGQRVDFPDNKGKSGQTYSGEVLLSDALAWLEENKAKPFFLHLSLQQPHLDLNAPPAWRNKYLGRFQEKPTEPGHYRAESHPKATFAAMVAYLDHTVGKVLDKLQEVGVAEDTLVIFASDNGPVNEGGWSCEHFDSNGPLRGHKRDMYEGGIRVPMIAYWPGVIQPGASDHVSAFWDFAPTACELAGADRPDGIDGLSYAPTLLGHGKQQQHEHLYWEFHEQGGKQAVRQGDWKAVRLGALRDSNSRIELYNLATDLAEQQDLAAQHPEIVRRMGNLMNSSHVPSDLFRIPPVKTGEI